MSAALPSTTASAAGRLVAASPLRWFRRTGWRHVLAVAAVVFALFPIEFIVLAALNPAGTLSSSSLIPYAASLDNFRHLFNDPVRPYLNWYLNSILIAGVGTVGSVFIGACSAYAFSRFRFRGRRAGLLFILLIQMFPAMLAFIALYITFAKISDVLPAIGLNTAAGLILVYLGGAMGGNIWLLKGYFDTVPRELDEAAKMDGASHAQIFFGMILRLVTPVLVTVAMLSFTGLINEFMLASIFLTAPERKTLAVGLWAMNSADHNQYFGEFCAGALLASLPVVVLYLSLQRYIVSGLTSGSVKG